MKITIISDTHGDHEKLGRLAGDVLIHCGDMFNMFSPADEDFEQIDDWFGQQDFELVICVGGNHDFEIQRRSNYVDNPFRNAVYLEGKSYAHKGVNFYGAPWIPELRGQAFFKEDAELKALWSEIPANTDVLVTHTPPSGILDVSSKGLKLGCPYLGAALSAVRPRLHCFGHVHASSGTKKVKDITYINAALVNRQYKLALPPYEFYLP